MSGNFEVVPCGTQARLAAVEAELRSMHRCFGVTELARDKYKAERDALLEALKAVEPILTRMYGPQAAELPPMQIVRAAIAQTKGGSNG